MLQPEDIEVLGPIDTIEYDYPDFHLSMDCFWCEVIKGELMLKEAEDRKLHAGDIVQHFKRETLSKKDRDKNKYLYKIVGIAKHTETEETVVVYQSLYGDFEMYVRPYDMFMGEVDKKKYPDIKQTYRFEKVKEEE